METRVKEAIRYLGFGRNTVDDKTMALISDSFKELESAVVPKSIYRIFDLHRAGDTKVVAGNLEIESRNLAKNLLGCDSVVLFGATLGPSVDRLLARYAVTDMAKAVVMQACAAAFLEEYCDACQEEIERETEKSGRHLRPRFSPGYGDFDIRYQVPIVRILDCPKTIGLTLTDSCMMTPTKSVTAVIGVSATEERCHIKGCEICEKKDCIYRRDTI